MKQPASALKIQHTDLRFTREPLLAPFGFKGGSVDELWQILCRIEDAKGREGVGLGVQSILWSDADVFAAFSQSGGNAAMLLVTQRALKLLENRTLTTPPDLIDAILP
ncbi:MAG: L-alanine-DL-glutamate epimerase, partial [Clostridiaceae bacterium]|nr:L-alanine-DL-glutamate epimerase [Clostridiaceae bacterium]